MFWWQCRIQLLRQFLGPIGWPMLYHCSTMSPVCFLFKVLAIILKILHIMVPGYLRNLNGISCPTHTSRKGIYWIISAVIVPALCNIMSPEVRSRPILPKVLEDMAVPTNLGSQWGSSLEVANVVDNTLSAPCVHFAPSFSILINFILIF